MEMENIILGYPGSEGQKSHVFSPYMDYRTNANTAILWKTGHTKGKSHIRGVRKKKETKMMIMVDVFSIQERI
jgi:hypothetical protein